MAVALITGSGTGIGKAIALELAKSGYKLILCGPAMADLSEVGKSSGAEFLARDVDVRSSENMKKLISDSVRRFGQIDLLVNNAGVRHLGTVLETSDEDWSRVLDTNLKGAFITSREVLPHMIEQKSGLIVNISSINGLHPLPRGSAYCASKAGLNSLTKSLAQEVEQHGLNVFSVCPYAVNTKVHAKLFPEQKDGLLMTPEYVANRIVKLILSKRVKPGSLITIKKPLWRTYVKKKEE